MIVLISLSLNRKKKNHYDLRNIVALNQGKVWAIYHNVDTSTDLRYPGFKFVISSQHENKNPDIIKVLLTGSVLCVVFKKEDDRDHSSGCVCFA